MYEIRNDPNVQETKHRKSVGLIKFKFWIMGIVLGNMNGCSEGRRKRDDRRKKLCWKFV